MAHWQCEKRAIVCPRAYSAKSAFETAARASADRGWPVVLRPTGGGAVPQGPGVTNLALAFNAPEGLTIEGTYRMLTGIIRDALGALGEELRTGETPGSFCDGAWNLSVGDQKLVGTAQRWRPARGGCPRVLAHALILVDDRFQKGTSAIAKLHEHLLLSPVRAAAQTNLKAAFGLEEVPAAALHACATQALHDLMRKQK
ncbi:MAG: hypothetical protein AAF509_13745 [Pseudomonadota bacterium]